MVQRGSNLPHTSTLKSFLSQGLAKNTRAAYSKCADTWIQFLASHRLIDSSLQPLALWSTLQRNHQTHCVIAYIKWLHDIKLWSHAQIRSNISGVRDYIRGHLLDLDAFNHESVPLALKATQLDRRALSITREAKKRLPITAEMINWAKEQFWRCGAVTNVDDIDNRMKFLAATIGITFLRRVSEYTYDPRSGHTILADDVHFISKSGSSRTIPSYAVKTSRISFNDIATVRFIFRTSKTDQGGRGSYHFLQSHNARERELMKCIWDWCQVSGLKMGVPFFSRVYNSRRKLCRPCMVNETLKIIADNFGLEHVRDSFTSHSLRIGGATALIASGASRETIQRIGSWSTSQSASDSIYELQTPHENSNLWSALRNNTTRDVSVSDIISIIPPTHSRK